MVSFGPKPISISTFSLLTQGRGVVLLLPRTKNFTHPTYGGASPCLFLVGLVLEWLVSSSLHGRPLVSIRGFKRDDHLKYHKATYN